MARIIEFGKPVDHEKWRDVATETYVAWVTAKLPGNLLEFKTCHFLIFPCWQLHLHFFVDYQGAPRVRAHAQSDVKLYLGEMRLHRVKTGVKA